MPGEAVEVESALRNDLELADWRRQIGELYAEVRRLAATEPEAAVQHWRSERERLIRTHAQSPLPDAARSGFEARHFPYDRSLRFELALLPDRPGDPAGLIQIATSSGTSMQSRRVGWVAVPFPQGSRRLLLTWLEGYAGGLFLSFRDASNGVETYGGGRYLLDTAKGADLGGDPARVRLIVDFNFAYQPSCAFDPRWLCPLTPPENVLDLAVRAGERLV